MGTPVQTSLGTARWLTLVEWPAVYPYGLLDETDPATFRRKYRARLHKRGRRILAELEELREAYGALVLCCWEDLAKPEAWCHRRLLAEWIEEKTGLQVEEVPV